MCNETSRQTCTAMLGFVYLLCIHCYRQRLHRRRRRCHHYCVVGKAAKLYSLYIVVVVIFASFHFTRHVRMHFNIFVLLSMENWLQILYEMCIAWADLYVAIVAIKMRTMQVLCIEAYFRTADRSTHDN